MEENNKKKKMTDLPFQIEGSLKKLFIGADEIKNKNYNRIEFLVDKLIPMGTLCALVGESDTGKSSLLRQLALSLVYGDSDFLGFKLKESCRNVIYVSTEDGEMATSVWLNKHFGKDQAKDDRLAKLKYVYNTEGIINNLKEVVKTNCVDLIIIDSYADLFTGSMNNSNEVRSFLNMYNNIANEFGVTVIFLHHTKKASAGMAPNKNSILGSQGFEAKMRSVLMLTKDDSDESLRHLCVIKNNYIPESSKSMSNVLRFNEYLSFDNTGDQVPLNELASEEWIPMAKQMKDNGKSYRQISGELSEKGHQVSKSSIQRKLL
jgi:RecA-family ATPase